MYRFAFAVALLFAAGWPCGPVFADSSVLVPSDNSSSSSLPVLDSGAPQGQTPAPTSSKTSVQSTPGVSLPALPQVVEVPVIKGEDLVGDPRLPNSLQISVASNSVWGTNDTSTVHMMLGIAPDDVSSHCRLAASGVMSSATNNGSVDAHGFDTGLKNDALFRYAGTLTGTSVHMKALCDLVPLPATASFVQKMGNNYLVYLSGIACDTAPNNTVQHLILQYAGNGTGKCVYQ